MAFVAQTIKLKSAFDAEVESSARIRVNLTITRRPTNSENLSRTEPTPARLHQSFSDLLQLRFLKPAKAASRQRATVQRSQILVFDFDLTSR